MVRRIESPAGEPLSLVTDAAVTDAQAEIERLRAEVEALRLRAEAAEAAADHDVLTPALNRRGFVSALRSAMAFCQRHQVPAVLLYLDLDGFKTVNDTLGHAAGEGHLLDGGELTIKGGSPCPLYPLSPISVSTSRDAIAIGDIPRRKVFALAGVESVKLSIQVNLLWWVDPIAAHGVLKLGLWMVDEWLVVCCWRRKFATKY